MSNKKYQLHWITAIIAVIKTLKEMIIPLILVFFVHGVNDTGNWFLDYLSFLIFGALLIIFFVTGLIRWKRFVYWFEDDELRIEYGLFVRKKRYIPFDRIQSLDYTESILHRPFNLVRVSVETAGGAATTEAEAVLTAITKEAAQFIEQEMNEAKKRRTFQQGEDGDYLLEGEQLYEENVERKVYEMGTRDLFILATTSGGVGLIISGFLVFLSQFAELLPIDKIYEEVSFFIKSGILLVVVAIALSLFIIWLISVGMTFLSYYNFTVHQTEEDIIITRGLIEKKRISVPLRRVQSIRINENPFRQLFGYANVIIHSAGGSVTGEGAKINLIPLVKKSRIQPLLQEVFEEMTFEEPARRLPQRSKKYYYRVYYLTLLPILIFLSFLYFPYGLISFGVIPLIISWGIWRQRSAAFHIFDDQLTMRFRVFSLQTVFMKKKRIQSMQLKQNYFNKKNSVATISASVKSGMLAYRSQIKHIEEAKAEEIFDWYNPNVKRDVKVESKEMNQPFNELSLDGEQ